jgi:hypothetical protein
MKLQNLLLPRKFRKVLNNHGLEISGMLIVKRWKDKELKPEISKSTKSARCWI